MPMENLIQTYDSPHALVVENYPDPVAEDDCQMPIWLHIDYRKQTVRVIHRNYDFDALSEEEYGGLVETFDLPQNVDATRLRAFVDAEIMPLIGRVVAGFEEGFDRQANRVATFTDDANDARLEIGERLCTAPRTFEIAFWPACHWFVDCPADLASDTTDDDLRALAARLMAEDEEQEHVRIVGGLDAVVRCFASYREDMREEG